jgi:peptidoglycan hydrolase-like amidase
MEIRVLLKIDLEEYLRGVVPAEVYSTWPTEALMAQSILARTYALYHKQHPRGKDFDLYGDTRSQVYDMERAHPYTDAAVAMTSGVYIADVDGSPRFVEYVSKCGGMECLYCNGRPGHDGKVWPGRVCQYGMRELAANGASHEQILSAYLGDVVLKEAE